MNLNLGISSLTLLLMDISDNNVRCMGPCFDTSPNICHGSEEYVPGRSIYKT
ncbi:uncharacterized protein PHALS_00690 [Plasmopara halstedii]|uniref:Uncharacterized protein n=1 Tax=Plasmopara halstedii TaxID=4781 RepID=A0A0P1ARU0_PLAHL|nr:uncharacterized protein PHALS_00690 [Plasmopara halstedii]CEG44321.1 hypothetical protein PHALS_00690 [Plasmopara halstedii]|eukprot:XP_024580690.1 hypothetical protein PHALS_00690 [Plasmopara halstedii]